MQIVQNGRVYQLADFTATSMKLQPSIYLIRYNEVKDYYYLVELELFKLPKKLYGDFSVVDRYIKSFNDSSKNMGVLLSGEKGGGKTITAQLLCQKIQLPVFVLTQPFKGETFIDFITNPLWGKFVLFIDEFEKVYKKDDKEKNPEEILQLMDGNFQTRILFLLTVNEMRINEYMINRLGRIRYRKHFDSLEDSVIQEVIDDILINKDHSSSIYEFFDIINMSTFDLLINIITEMNRFNEDALTAGKYLNLEVSEGKYDVYDITKNSQLLIGMDISFNPKTSEEIYFIRIDDRNKRSKENPNGHYGFVDIEGIVPSDDIKKISRNEYVLEKDGIKLKFVKIIKNKSLVF
jgi:hypothetical protein